MQITLRQEIPFNLTHFKIYRIPNVYLPASHGRWDAHWYRLLCVAALHRASVLNLNLNSVSGPVWWGTVVIHPPPPSHLACRTPYHRGHSQWGKGLPFWSGRAPASGGKKQMPLDQYQVQLDCDPLDPVDWRRLLVDLTALCIVNAPKFQPVDSHKPTLSEFPKSCFNWSAMSVEFAVMAGRWVVLYPGCVSCQRAAVISSVATTNMITSGSAPRGRKWRNATLLMEARKRCLHDNPTTTWRLSRCALFAEAHVISKLGNYEDDEKHLM